MNKLLVSFVFSLVIFLVWIQSIRKITLLNYHIKEFETSGNKN